MYKDIEKIYKKSSPYNKLKKSIIWIYFVFVPIFIVLNFFYKIILMILTFIVMLIFMKIVSERILKIKLNFIILKKNNDEIRLETIFKNEETKVFKDYTMKNNLYNEKSLLCIIEHYRNMAKPKINDINLLTILSILIPILLSFYSKDGFDIYGFLNVIPYLIVFVLTIVILYFSLKQIIEIKKFIKGEDGMAERLEEIFSELYADYNNIANTKKAKKIKKK